MRIDVNISEELRKRVAEYAQKKGIRIPRAYAELIEKGLEHGENTS